MIKIAIIQFPGLNTEYETRREINKAGMVGEFFRWNDDPEKLKKYQGYVIGGGFSYEDRGRAGIVAALDPIMEVLKAETAGGKPLLAICNGCQIAVESGLVPEPATQKLYFGMGRNKRMQNGEVLGTGYYNDWVYLQNSAPKGRTAFTRSVEEKEIFACTVAHGEGRFMTSIPGLVDRLIKNQQIVFRYCDKNGNPSPEFPVNPNGSLWNIAAVCNPEGNILALMPHPERTEDSQTFFVSMRDYIENACPKWKNAHGVNLPVLKEHSSLPEEKYMGDPQSFQLLVDLLITDNETDTFQTTLKRLGFENVTLSRQTHFEIGYQKIRGAAKLEKFAKQLIQSGLLLNTNKESAAVVFPKTGFGAMASKLKKAIQGGENAGNFGSAKISLLVRDKQDLIGLSKSQTLKNRLGIQEIAHIKKSTLWHIFVDTKSEKTKELVVQKLMRTHLFANPHSQDVLRY